MGALELWQIAFLAGFLLGGGLGCLGVVMVASASAFDAEEAEHRAWLKAIAAIEVRP